MGERNQVHEVLSLRSKETPAGTRVLTLLSAEGGIMDAFVFGGPKSKLRSLAAPWSSGRAFLYYDPVRDYLKLSDFEVVESFPAIRDSLRRIMGASLVSELLMKTSGSGGDYAEVLGLSRDCLLALDLLPEERSDYPLLLFVWRLVGLLGLLPDLDECVRCGRSIPPGGGRSWLPREGGFACPSCAGDEDSGPGLSAGALRWLERSASLPFASAFEVGLDEASRGGLRRLVFSLARSAVEGPLESLEAGAGIL